jgi:Domain of unknown function (DUF4157)/Nucleotidyltransferase domain
MSHAVLARESEAAPASRAKASSKAASGNLRIREPGDAFEREADRVADEVMAGGRTRPEWSLSRMSIAPPVQRKCACGGSGGSEGECEECKEKKTLQRNAVAVGPVKTGVAPAIVNEALRSPGQPLDRATRDFFEPRLGHDFSQVRVHADNKAARSAEAVAAHAYTVGEHVVFGAGQYSPSTRAGGRLMAHELAHTVQQGPVEATGGLRISSPAQWSEQRADAAALAALNGRTPSEPGNTGPMIARQAKPAQEDGKEGDEKDKPKDTFAGTMISEIIVSLARGRVGFRWSAGMILGNIKTDLKPGQYELKPDVAKRRWVIQKPAVKSGLRFDVNLEGADPWTLAYPDTLPLTVAAGSAVEPKTFGEMQTDGKVIDPLWLYEGIPEGEKTKPVKGIDDFESTRYDLSYRSEKGNLSKWLTVSYRDNTARDINLDSITKDTPRLWAAKQEALKVMDDYNALFILGTFPTVFFIITISPTVSVPGRPGTGYTATRRQFPKTGGGGGEFEPPAGGTRQGGEEPGPPAAVPGQEPGTGPALPPKAADGEPPAVAPGREPAPGQKSSAEGSAAAKGLELPQGMNEQQFQQMSQKIRAGTSQYGNDVRVHGSRAAGNARPDSDIDIAVRVQKDKFDQIIQDSFGKPNPGSAKQRTMLNAVKTGKIQAGEAGLRGLRQSVAKDIGMDVDLSVIQIGGEFDNGPWIPLR